MFTIKTAKGNVHEVFFCGVGSILGTLVFDMLDGRSAGEIIAEFDEPENTKTITFFDGRTEVVYEGYTRFETYALRGPGVVRISLAKQGGVS